MYDISEFERELTFYELNFITKEVLGKDYAYVRAFGLTKEDYDKVLPYLKRALDEPVEYIFSKAYFRNLVLYVDRNVLIPRNETEQLVEIALGMIRSKGYSRILEIGIGSGAISISLALESRSTLFANDISYEALKVARMNVRKYNLEHRIYLFVSDALKAIKGRFDMVIWNYPYVMEWEYELLSSKVKAEPKVALVSDISQFESFLSSVPESIDSGGACLLEISPEISYIARKHGFKILKDSYNAERFALLEL